jgi:hypothetical protein
MQIVGFALGIGQERLTVVRGLVVFFFGGFAAAGKFFSDSTERAVEKSVAPMKQKVSALEKFAIAISLINGIIVIMVIAALFILVVKTL